VALKKNILGPVVAVVGVGVGLVGVGVGVGLVGVGVGVGVGATSLIVKIAGLLPTLPPLRTKFTVSGPSVIASVNAGTVKLALFCPGAKFREPAATV